jgi:hypothetical protein
MRSILLSRINRNAFLERLLHIFSQLVGPQENRCETRRNALRGLCTDKAGSDTLRQFYLTELSIGVTVLIRQPDNLCGKMVRVTVTSSLTRNRQGIYFL